MSDRRDTANGFIGVHTKYAWWHQEYHLEKAKRDEDLKVLLDEHELRMNQLKSDGIEIPYGCCFIKTLAPEKNAHAAASRELDVEDGGNRASFRQAARPNYKFADVHHMYWAGNHTCANGLMTIKTEYESEWNERTESVRIAHGSISLNGMEMDACIPDRKIFCGHCCTPSEYRPDRMRTRPVFIQERDDLGLDRIFISVECERGTNSYAPTHASPLLPISPQLTLNPSPGRSCFDNQPARAAQWYDV